ncbi:MAG TPA: sulfatase-like hydrolase/transferase [Limnochordia bacterium]|nr:sulfatase-like hydrolase/transferase [Limnochordia bacterium]
MASTGRSGPPNILLIQADQHRADLLGGGHPKACTPALDRLAREGVRFRRAFTPIPLCAPSRTSLFTGQWPSTHLTVVNHNTEAPHAVTPDAPTFSRLLHDAGYTADYVGKWDVHPQLDPTHFGFDTYVPEAEYAKWRAAKGLPGAPKHGWFGGVDPGITPEQSRLAWGADLIIERLRARAAGERPFLISWNPSEPHLPVVVPEPYASLVDPAELEPWPNFADTLQGKPYMQRQHRRTWQLEGVPWRDFAPMVARYIGQVALLDAQVGRILAELDRLGLARETLVVYVSDHGDLTGSHGLIDKHYMMYDEVLRVPLILRWPGVLSAGLASDAFVSSGIDVCRTLVRAAGVEPAPTMCGQDLVAVATGAAAGRDDIFSMYFGNQFGLYSARMVRESRLKYVWNAVAEDELYDLASDPHELENRAADPAYASDLARLRRRTVEWMQETGDRLLNEWTRRVLMDGLKG